MAYEFNDLKIFLFLVLFTIQLTTSANIDCNGKPFHCLNSTHFMICVDLGGKISTTIDDFVLQCPPTTECRISNRYECEFPKEEVSTTLQSVTIAATPKELNVLPVHASTFIPNEVTTILPLPENNTDLPVLEEKNNLNKIEMLEDIKEDFSDGKEKIFESTEKNLHNDVNRNLELIVTNDTTLNIGKNNSDSTKEEATTFYTTEITVTGTPTILDTTTSSGDFYESSYKYKDGLQDEFIKKNSTLDKKVTGRVIDITTLPSTDTERGMNFDKPPDNIKILSQSNNDNIVPNMIRNTATEATINEVMTTDVKLVTTTLLSPENKKDLPSLEEKSSSNNLNVLEDLRNDFTDGKEKIFKSINKIVLNNETYHLKQIIVNDTMPDAGKLYDSDFTKEKTTTFYTTEIIVTDTPSLLDTTTLSGHFYEASYKYKNDLQDQITNKNSTLENKFTEKVIDITTLPSIVTEQRVNLDKPPDNSEVHGQLINNNIVPNTIINTATETTIDEVMTTNSILEKNSTLANKFTETVIDTTTLPSIDTEQRINIDKLPDNSEVHSQLINDFVRNKIPTNENNSSTKNMSWDVNKNHNLGNYTQQDMHLIFRENNTLINKYEPTESYTSTVSTNDLLSIMSKKNITILNEQYNFSLNVDFPSSKDEQITYDNTFSNLSISKMTESSLHKIQENLKIPTKENTSTTTVPIVFHINITDNKEKKDTSFNSSRIIIQSTSFQNYPTSNTVIKNNRTDEESKIIIDKPINTYQINNKSSSLDDEQKNDTLYQTTKSTTEKLFAIHSTIEKFVKPDEINFTTKFKDVANNSNNVTKDSESNRQIYITKFMPTKLNPSSIDTITQNHGNTTESNIMHSNSSTELGNTKLYPNKNYEEGINNLRNILVATEQNQINTQIATVVQEESTTMTDFVVKPNTFQFTLLATEATITTTVLNDIEYLNLTGTAIKVTTNKENLRESSLNISEGIETSLSLKNVTDEEILTNHIKSLSASGEISNTEKMETFKNLTTEDKVSIISSRTTEENSYLIKKLPIIKKASVPEVTFITRPKTDENPLTQHIIKDSTGNNIVHLKTTAEEPFRNPINETTTESTRGLQSEMKGTILLSESENDKQTLSNKKMAKQETLKGLSNIEVINATLLPKAVLDKGIVIKPINPIIKNTSSTELGTINITQVTMPNSESFTKLVAGVPLVIKAGLSPKLETEKYDLKSEERISPLGNTSDKNNKEVRNITKTLKSIDDQQIKNSMPIDVLQEDLSTLNETKVATAIPLPQELTNEETPSMATKVSFLEETLNNSVVEAKEETKLPQTSIDEYLITKAILNVTTSVELSTVNQTQPIGSTLLKKIVINKGALTTLVTNTPFLDEPLSATVTQITERTPVSKLLTTESTLTNYTIKTTENTTFISSADNFQLTSREKDTVPKESYIMAFKETNGINLAIDNSTARTAIAGTMEQANLKSTVTNTSNKEPLRKKDMPNRSEIKKIDNDSNNLKHTELLRLEIPEINNNTENILNRDPDIMTTPVADLPSIVKTIKTIDLHIRKENNITHSMLSKNNEQSNNHTAFHEKMENMTMSPGVASRDHFESLEIANIRSTTTQMKTGILDGVTKKEENTTEEKHLDATTNRIITPNPEIVSTDLITNNYNKRGVTTEAYDSNLTTESNVNVGYMKIAKLRNTSTEVSNINIYVSVSITIPVSEVYNDKALNGEKPSKITNQVNNTNNDRNTNKTPNQPNNTSQPVSRNIKYTQTNQSTINGKSVTNFATGQKSINRLEFDCLNQPRGKYADDKDCRKFYICVGKLQPIIGFCPNNTVFCEYNKQCTKNLSHCVRNNQFHCLNEGRFIDFTKDNVYFICVKNNLHGFLRYKLQCLKGYHLNKVTVKCLKDMEISESISESESEKSNDRYKFTKSDESEIPENKNGFECKNEGYFPFLNDCNKYYLCYKNKNGEYRRKIKKCSGEKVYNKDKNKCVVADNSDEF